MTKGQKITIIASSILVSAVVGGVLYLYFSRKNVLKSLLAGETVTYKLSIPKLLYQTDKEYELKLNRDANSKSGNAIMLYQDGELSGQYWLIDGDPYFVSDKEQTKTKIKNLREASFVKYILNNV